MKEMIDSLRLQIHERLSSPLFGSLLLAWVAWNHRFLVVLFSNLSVKERFDIIDQQLYTTGWDKWGKGLFCPLVTAILFILVYPYPAKWLYGYWHKRQREQKELRDKIEGATLLTVEESNDIRRQVFASRIESDEVIQRLQNEIDTLRKRGSGEVKIDMSEPIRIQTHESTKIPESAKPATKPKETVGKDIPDGTLNLIGVLAKNHGEMWLSDAFRAIGNDPPVRKRYYLDEGLRRGLMRTSYKDGSNEHLTLTEKGRQFAVEAKFV